MGETKWPPWIWVVIQMAFIDFAPPRRCNCFWGKPNSQWLKYFLMAQFTMGWNCFWSSPNGQWVEIFSEGSIYNGFKRFWSNPNSQWLEIFSNGSIYNGLKLFLIQHRLEMGWNLFWMHKDSQSLSKLYLLQKYDFCMPLDFLGIKYFKKIKIWILDNTVVFLAFMVLKVKTKVLPQFSMLADLNFTTKHFRTKYPISIHCVLVGASFGFFRLWKFTQYPQKTWHKQSSLPHTWPERILRSKSNK